MKISASWLRELFPHDVDVQQAAQVLTATGLEVEGVDHVEAVPGGLRGVVVGHVTEVVQHPNADRLRMHTPRRIDPDAPPLRLKAPKGSEHNPMDLR